MRIFINKELENLSIALKKAINLLNLGGTIVVISYHSLEDRIVKNTFKYYAEKEKDKFKILCKKPVLPESTEVEDNNKSRSAKLRVIKRTK